MKIENALVQIDYLDNVVTIFDDTTKTKYNPARHQLVVSRNYSYDLGGRVDKYCDPSFLPNIGDEIHVVSGCPIPTQDFRNNYRLKREFDGATCNVFSNVDRYSFRKKYISFLYESTHNIIVASIKNTDSNLSYSQRISNCKGVIPYEYRNLEFNFYDEELDLCFYPESKSYIELLLRQCKKPCVMYSNLKMNRNDITIDILNMVHSSCTKRERTKENIDNAILVLSSFSQYNWKEFPLTTYFLFNILEYKTYGVYGHLRKIRNTAPKAIRELISVDHCFDGVPTESDRNMCLQFAGQLLGIHDTIFVSMEDLTNKLDKFGIRQNMFRKIYDTTVRISPKKV